jgi:hypothetical protein
VGGKKQAAICNQAVEFDCSAQSQTLLTSKSTSAQWVVGLDGKGKAQRLCFLREQSTNFYPGGGVKCNQFATVWSNLTMPPSHLSYLTNPINLVGKSAQNSVEFRNYSDSGPFSCRNFDWNFVFPIVKHVPANSEHVPDVLEYFPAIDSPDFMHQKKFLSFFMLPTKITSTCLPSKTDSCNFCGMVIFPPKLHLLVLRRCKFGGMIISPAKIT